MKQLMIGNAAIARGAYEAGVTVASAYPGTPSTEILENFCTYEEVYAEWAPNEKVALEVAAGASIAGARALATMKHVGVNVAADPLFTMAYVGVNGGLVLVSADDPGMHSSQNEQDNRGYGKYAKIPILEPSDSQEALDFTKTAYALSEQFDTPVILRITTRLAHSQTMVELGEPENYELKPYKKDALKNVMLPAHAKMRHVVVEKHLAELAVYGETTPLNRIEINDRSLGIITSGIAYQYVKEALPEASVLKLGMVFPLPEKLIRDFAAQVDRLVVVEELEPFIEDQLKAWGIAVEGKSLFTVQGEYSPAMLAQALSSAEAYPVAYDLTGAVPGRPPLLCPGCPHRGTFHVLRKLKLTVSGDIGCYTLGTLAPLESVDTCVCMGASIGIAHGMEKARGRDFAKKTVAVIGDSTFVHSGITGIINSLYNQGSGVVMILDNDTTAMTGHQDHPATGRTLQKMPAIRLDIPALLQAVGVKNVRTVDPLDIEALEQILKEELEREELSVIIAKRSCALLPGVIFSDRLQVISDKCTGCKMCIRVGCTGVHFLEEDKKAEMTAACVGCGLCASVCKFDAIVKTGRG